MQEACAQLKNARVSAQKTRLVANLIRGLPVGKALNALTFSTKKSARLIKKLLRSAIANAEHNFGADIDELRVASVYADQGPTYKRMQAKAKGRGARILKPTCHITVIVSDQEKS